MMLCRIVRIRTGRVQAIPERMKVPHVAVGGYAEKLGARFGAHHDRSP